mgnify:CR=1 FL=1
MDYPGGPHVITVVLENERGRQKRGRGQSHYGRMIKGTVPCFEAGEDGLQAKECDMGGLRKLGKKRKSSRRNTALLTP